MTEPDREPLTVRELAADALGVASIAIMMLAALTLPSLF